MNLKEYRVKNNLTQIELAETIGVSSSSISQYERGNIPNNAVKKLIDRFLENNTNENVAKQSEVVAFDFDNTNTELEAIQIQYIDLLASELINAKDINSKRMIIDKLNKTIEVF